MPVRTELERLMRATLADHQHWTYRAVRPLPLPPTWHPGQHVVSDCSWGVKLLCLWAGHKDDPTGASWSTDWGNSATMAAHLRHLLTPSTLQIGDPVTFGPGGRDHAAMVLEPGLDPLLWSDGHQGAPNTYRLSQDGRQHQLLQLPVAKPAVTPPASLRARIGYWSWLAWTLGEQDWQPYGEFNATVRPNVPRNIALRRPTWWAARLRFITARKKPNPPKGPA